MEIYNGENNTTEKYNEPTTKRSFFPRSQLNDWLPLWEKILFFLFGYLGLKIISRIMSYIFMSTSLVVFKDGVAYLTTLGSVLLNFLTYLLLCVGFIGILVFDKRKTYKKILEEFKNPTSYLWALIGFGLVLGSQTLLSNIFAKCFTFYGSNNNESSLETMTKYYPVLLIIMTAFFAPFCEELTYRVGLVDVFGHIYKFRWVGLLASAVVFGLIHTDLISTYSKYFTLVQNSESTAEAIQTAKYTIYNEWLNLPIYAISGFCLAFTYAKSGKITSSMLAHMGVNLLSMLTTIISNTGGN
jgi:membrane protease YdiL (CAAX protease family)